MLSWVYSDFNSMFIFTQTAIKLLCLISLCFFAPFKGFVTDPREETENGSVPEPVPVSPDVSTYYDQVPLR